MDELKHKANITDILSRFVNLQRRGSVYVANCPFHSERTPSFTVFPDTQNYYCFGCHAGGDVITFLRASQNLEYVDAVRMLADMTGVPFPEDTGERESGRIRKQLLEANKEAARFFNKVLMSEQGKAGLEYLMGKRRLTAQTITKFGLGFAPDSWDMLTRHLMKMGFSKEILKLAGLCRTGKNGKEYDMFRNRVMFPIIDTSGNVVAFGGRVMDGSEPKYLNTSETPVFKKSKTLFALNFARTSCKERMILAEGYMDVIALHQAGFTYAVATLGTAMTPDHARIMGNYTKQLIVAYDSDKAGKAATQRAIEHLNEAGVAVKILRITGGKDPDEFIKTYGADKFKLLLDKSEDHAEYRLDEILAKYDISETAQKVACAKEMASLIATFANGVEREIYTVKAAELCGVDKTVLTSEIARLYKQKAGAQRKKRFSEDSAALTGISDKVNTEKYGNLGQARAEEYLLTHMLRRPEDIEKISKAIAPEEFVTEFDRRVYIAIQQMYAEHGEIDIAVLGESFTVAEISRISEFMRRELYDDEQRAVRDCIEKLKSAHSKVKKTEIEQMQDDELLNIIGKIGKAKQNRNT